MKTIAVFNNKGGVGKTSLVYHLAWMYARLDVNVLVADLDPQANLTSMFLNDEELESLWADDRADGTIYTSLQPLLEGTGDVTTPHVTEPAPGIGLVAGDMLLSGAEDELTSQWPACLGRKPRAFRVLSAISRALHGAAEQVAADLILMDVGPNLGALNRAVLVSADHVVVPLAADLYSIRGLHNLGPTLRQWRQEWSERRERNPVPELDVPRGDMQPMGYVVLQHAVRLNRPVMAYERWMERIPGAYRDFVVGEPARPALSMDEDERWRRGKDDTARDGPARPALSMDEDEHCLATLKHYRSLMPLAQEARKPMFALKPADGVIGSQVNAVQACYRDFRALARIVAEQSGVTTA